MSEKAFQFNQVNYRCPKKRRKEMLKSYGPAAINAICDCITNVVHGNIPISTQQKGKLRKKIPVLRELIHPKKSAAYKKKLILQHGEGFLSTILGPAIKVLASAFDLS